MPRAEPAVRRALEAAAVECITDYWCAQDWQQAEARREAAAAIAAFLRALPEGSSVPAGQGDLRVSVGPMPALAAAVERAAAEVE
jgi:hypothetical protein